VVLCSVSGPAGLVSSSSSFFNWFMVLALLGVWTSVAVVYFDLVDYQGVIDKAKNIQINLSEELQGKLAAYDADGDGDFDVEDAKVLLGDRSSVDGDRLMVLDWLEEGGSDWFNGFFTFLYGLMNPLDATEEEEERSALGQRARMSGNRGQKVIIVGLQNQ
uniref:Aspartyl beta-hydroxylase/Triadin domain-containing protein n=1 Tax=Cynoglossus semilaevis TaxID=244447 RepID=A0A3P8X385_CYNSE